MEYNCKKHGLTEFVLRSDGRYRCKKCSVDAVSKRKHKIKKMAVEYMGGKCQNTSCGYSKYLGALEFHHIDNNKSFSISENGHTRSWDILKNELNKCIMLCSNCHKEIHANLIDISNIEIIRNDELIKKS